MGLNDKSHLRVICIILHMLKVRFGACKKNRDRSFITRLRSMKSKPMVVKQATSIQIAFEEDT